MTVRKSQMLLPNPTTGKQEVHHLETELEQIEDMTAYMRELNKKASAPEVRKALEVGYFRRARKAFTLANLSAAVASGNYNQYDILPGDYFTGASGYTYIFAGHNPLRGSHSFTITANHAGLIVHTHTGCKWNETNDTSGGYVGSVLHSYLVDTVLPNVKADLGGESHLYAHTKIYTTGINPTGYNRHGSATGCSNSYASSDNQYIAALSEMQVFGGTMWSSSGYDSGEADQQLDVFKMFKHTAIFGMDVPWLRDIVSATEASIPYQTGIATPYAASAARSVAALVAFH